MKARFAQILSRLSIVALLAGSAVGATACARAQPVDTQPAAVAAEETPQAAPVSVHDHTPGRHVFKRIEAMDLRPGQREAMTEIEQNLAADLAPHRETMRQVAATLVSGVEAGRLAPGETEAQKAALVAMITDAKGVIAGAINDIHDNLDPAQRKELVEQLEAERAAHSAPQAEHGDCALSRVALEVGITEEQKQELRNEFQKELDELVPDRAARREANEARLNAMAQAFVTDDFDAADFEIAGGIEDGVKAFGAAAEHAIALGGAVLTQGQRSALAAVLRDHASKI
jgi:hypothetical protein